MALAGACNPHEEKAVEPMGKPISELAAIDSLMWRQPDSALTVMLEFAGSSKADSLNEFEGHYCQVLVSELLYKNDYRQSNREELMKAVCYFDSLVMADGRCESEYDRNAFLDARAHYINGVGFYERGDVVNACEEYLKTLEVMEEHFEEIELVGHKARFMAYTYNRLGDIFSEQFMTESAIVCYESSCVYSTIAPITDYSISNTMYRIGKQYNIKGDTDSACLYYLQALANMPDTNNLYYRDIVSTKALLSYQTDHQAEVSVKRIKQMADLADDYDERLTRYYVIGDVYYEEGLYDSALLYLEPVFNHRGDDISRIQAAQCLHLIYEIKGDDEKSGEYMQFLARQKKSEGQNKALVATLENMFNAHMGQKKTKYATEAHKESIKKTFWTIISIAIMVALAIIVFAKLRSKKLLKVQQEEAEKTLKERDERHAKALEVERQAHRFKLAALSGRLKRKNQEVRELKDQIKQQEDLAAKSDSALSFTEEPICRLIMERVNEGRFLSQMDCTIYKDYALNKDQLSALRNAADRHFNRFTKRISKAHPELTRIDLDYCCLYLLGVTDADVAALMQRAYNTVNERNSKLKRIFGSENAISVTLQAIANGFASN